MADNVNENYKAILIDKRRVPYKHIEGNTFMNMHTKKMGTLTDEQCRLMLSLPVNLNYICGAFPKVEQLIGALKLKIE